MMAVPPLLSVEHVSKRYPGLPVLNDVSFAVEEGDIICLLGPSGVGKSTLLHIVAGLETPDTGQVFFAGQNLAGIPVHNRRFGLMFQDFALFPHKDVAANVAFGLRMAGWQPAKIAARVAEMLALVELGGYERRKVLDLSGGERQRVALARSLAPGPRLLMLDEPLGSLDRSLREQLMNQLRTILKRVGVTALYVTHDQQEAFAVADRVLIMRARLDIGQGGHVEQAGTPLEVYRQPASIFVARFLGFRNLFPGSVTKTSPAGPTTTVDTYSVDSPLGPLVAAHAATPCRPGERVTVLVRPEAAVLLPAGSTGPNVVPGHVASCSFRGSFYLLETAHEGDVKLTLEVAAVDAGLPVPGQALALQLEPDAITLLPFEPGNFEHPEPMF